MGSFFRVLFALSAVLLLNQNTSEAQEALGKVFEMDEIVVTAAPGERKIEETTSAVGVITEEEIDSSNSDYVMDVIGSMPGVYIRRDAIYGRQDITIRGLGSNVRRLQVLVDGRPEKMSLFGCTVTQTLPLSNVERIEVVRGPESVLYGTDAMGGVINIITKKVSEPGFESGATFSYGGFVSMHSLVRHGGNTGAFDYYLTYDRKQSDGHRDNSAYDADFASFRGGYDFNNHWRTEFAGQYLTDRGENPGPENAPYRNNETQEYTRYSWDADLTGIWDKSELLFTLYDNSGEHQFDMPSIDDYWHSNDRTLGLNARYSHEVYQHVDTKDVLTTGYEFQNQWAEPGSDWVKWARSNMPARYMEFGEYDRNNHDLYVFNELTQGRLINTLGLRGHWDDHSKTIEVLPHIGVHAALTDRTSARAKIGKGFRQPRFSELHLFPAHDEDLDPEVVWSYEAAVTHIVASWLSVTINPFYMDVKNLIQTVSNPTPPPLQINRNSGNYGIAGVETSIEAFLVKNLSVSLNYTYSSIEDGPSDNPNVNRQGEPEHVIDTVVQYSAYKWSVSMQGQYISGLYDSDLLAGGAIGKVDDFGVVGIKGSYKVHRFADIFLGVDNLLDVDYEQIPGYPMPGARLYGGITLTTTSQ